MSDDLKIWTDHRRNCSQCKRGRKYRCSAGVALVLQAARGRSRGACKSMANGSVCTQRRLCSADRRGRRSCDRETEMTIKHGKYTICATNFDHPTITTGQHTNGPATIWVKEENGPWRKTVERHMHRVREAIDNDTILALVAPPTVEELRDVIRDFCFKLTVGDTILACPACGTLKGMEHNEQCRIGAVLPHGEKFLRDYVDPAPSEQVSQTPPTPNGFVFLRNDDPYDDNVKQFFIALEEFWNEHHYIDDGLPAGDIPLPPHFHECMEACFEYSGSGDAAAILISHGFKEVTQ